MQVRDIMSEPVRVVRADAEALHAAELMALHEVGALPVIDHTKLVGIVTDRDIVLRCIVAGLSPVKTEVRRIMTAHPVAIGPDAPIEDAARIFLGLRVRRLPVVEDGQPVGMVTLDDLARLWNDDDFVLRIARRVAPRNRSTRKYAVA